MLSVHEHPGCQKVVHGMKHGLLASRYREVGLTMAKWWKCEEQLTVKKTAAQNPPLPGTCCS
jgi:hypothetical protein